MRSLLFGFLVVAGASLIASTLWHDHDKVDLNGEFWEFFEEAKLPMSSDGFIPKWNQSILICAYGKTPDNLVKDALESFQKATSTLPYLHLRIDWRIQVDDCSKATDLFFWIQQGDVFRADVEKNYLSIAEISKIEVDVFESYLYESAFGQTAFFSDGNNAVAAVLINQISKKRSKTADQFVKANILEELFQAVAIAGDLTLKGERRSILQEEFVHTASLWQGNYDDNEAVEYLKTRPSGICDWDVRLLALLYGMKVPDADPASYERILTSQKEDYAKRTKILTDTFKHQGLYDSNCDADNSGMN